MYQKITFGLLIMITLTLQGCTTDAPTDTVETTSPVVNIDTGNSAFNGTFNLTGNYTTPGGDEPFDATVTLENDVIIAVETKNIAIHEVSKKFQDKFGSGVAGQIVGKNIKDVQVAYVNGASLTSTAFNTALHALQK